MEFNPNFTYMLYSATAEDNVYYKDFNTNFVKKFHMVNFTVLFLINYCFDGTDNKFGLGLSIQHFKKD
jgi:hypothetical protein